MPAFNLAIVLLTRWLLFFLAFIACSSVIASPMGGAGKSPEFKTRIRLQLQWDHQAQFAGFYVAQSRKYFAEQGLEVEILPGGPNINPITELQQGHADIAVSWLSNAWQNTNSDKPVTNIAQIFINSSLIIICRASAGIFSAKDVIGKKIGVWNLGDELVVEEWMRRFKVPRDKVELVAQRPNGLDLIENKVPCATAMDYSEYWSLLRAGIDPSDIIIISDKEEVPHIEDGLYVLSERLQSEPFREALTRFLLASRMGWEMAKFSPTLAIETVDRVKPGLNKDQQRHMLENILNDIDYRHEKFGLLDLKTYESAIAKILSHGSVKKEPDALWTHEIWRALRMDEGSDPPIRFATRHYVANVFESQFFKLFFAIGVLTFALSGVLEAINRGYDLWGRLVLAFVSGLGGGTIRDLLVGGDRYPLAYTRDITLPTGILVIVLASVLVTMYKRDLHHRPTFKKFKLLVDIIGFSVLATAGAMIAIVANLHWLWAPICAALSCAGGGMLRDIVINNEPATFKGVIYEEIAVIGALIFVFGLMIANHHEHSALPVYISIGVAVALIMVLRTIVYRYHLKYPKCLM